MFNKNYNFEGDSHTHIHQPERIDVHEHKAPTDESIKLYKQMVEKARSEVIDSLIIKDTIINGAVIFFRDEPWNGSDSWHIKFFINGEEKRISGKLDRDDYPFNPDILKNHILREIAMEVLKQLMETIKIHGPQTRHGKLC